MAFYFVSTFAIAQTPTKQPALRLSRTKNLHFAKAPFPGFSATDWEKDVTKNILMNKIKIRSLNFMRGRTFLNRYLIIDEAQNLTPKQIKNPDYPCRARHKNHLYRKSITN